MENASKALLIAGGILIALIIISLLVVMFTQIGDYQKSQSSGSKESQLAEFNRDFERYTEDEIWTSWSKSSGKGFKDRKGIYFNTESWLCGKGRDVGS